MCLILFRSIVGGRYEYNCTYIEWPDTDSRIGFVASIDASISTLSLSFCLFLVMLPYVSLALDRFVLSIYRSVSLMFNGTAQVFHKIFWQLKFIHESDERLSLQGNFKNNKRQVL